MTLDSYRNDAGLIQEKRKMTTTILINVLGRLNMLEIISLELYYTTYF